MRNNFISYFLLTWLLLLLCSLLFTAIRKKLSSFLTARGSYRMGKLYFLLLSLPFLPVLSVESPLRRFLKGIFSSQKDPAGEWRQEGLRMLSEATISSRTWMNDFAITLDDSGVWNLLGNQLLPLLLLGGFLVSAGLLLLSFRRLLREKKKAREITPWNSPAVMEALEQAKQQIPLKRPVTLLESDGLTAPVTFGIRKPVILIPGPLKGCLSQEEFHLIFLHELTHLQQKDNWMNLLFCFFRSLYWFHPVAVACLKSFQKSQESSCDEQVLTLLSQDNQLLYGRVLLHCASLGYRTPGSPITSSFQGEADSLKARILRITKYQPESSAHRRKTAVLLLSISILLLFQAPFLSYWTWAMDRDKVSEASFQTSATLKEQPVYQELLGDWEGVFVLHSRNTDTYLVSDTDKALQRCSPESTYKIYSALFALDQGIITPEENTLLWNGQQWPFPAWNQDQTLSHAMQASANWYFQDLDQHTGLLRLNRYFHELSYGNEDLSSGLDSYWMDGSLKISPLEQVQLLDNLWNNRLDFSSSHIQAVKDALLLETRGSCRLYGKTGTGAKEGKDAVGWFVGVLETPDDTYSFACCLRSQDSSKGTTAANLSLELLSPLWK